MQNLTITTLSAAELAQWQAAHKPFVLLDVRRSQAVAASGLQIAGAQWRDPALWLDWKDHVATDLPVVLYCAHGHEISIGLTATLLAMAWMHGAWTVACRAGRRKARPCKPLPRSNQHEMDYP